jgi:hypothetical protein
VVARRDVAWDHLARELSRQLDPFDRERRTTPLA